MPAGDLQSKFQRITVIGTGVMGCSIASLVRGRGLAAEVVGVDRVPAHLEMALRLGFIQRAEEDPARGVMGADAVVLAVPLDEVFIVLKKAGPDIRPAATVTCTAGTTLRVWQQVVREVEGMRLFVPSFPLVFSATQGPAAAAGSLLDGRECLVGDSETFAEGAVDRVCTFWTALGGKPQRTPVEELEVEVAGRHFLPLLVHGTLRELARERGWKNSEAALDQWLGAIGREVEPGKSFQLLARQLGGLLDELGGKLAQASRKLGGAREPTDPGREAKESAGDAG